MKARWLIRPLAPGDRDASLEIMYHGLYDQSAPLPDRSILELPILQPYLADFPRLDEIGFVAVDRSTEEVVGMVHCRFFTPDFCGVGFRDAATPELSIAVMPAFRGSGCGTALMSAVLNETDRRNLDVSLNCNPKNPARRLYERFDFRVIARRPIGNLMVRPANGRLCSFTPD